MRNLSKLVNVFFFVDDVPLPDHDFFGGICTAANCGVMSFRIKLQFSHGKRSCSRRKVPGHPAVLFMSESQGHDTDC